MAVLLFPPPPASRSHRAQPARLRRAPRAARAAFGSAERGCAPPPAQTFPKNPSAQAPKPPPKKPSPSPQKNSKKQMPQAGTSVLFAYYIDGGPSRPLFRKTTTEYCFPANRHFRGGFISCTLNGGDRHLRQQRPDVAHHRRLRPGTNHLGGGSRYRKFQGVLRGQPVTARVY